MSHAHAADLDDKTFNAKWDMLAKVEYGETDNLVLTFHQQSIIYSLIPAYLYVIPTHSISPANSQSSFNA